MVHTFEPLTRREREILILLGKNLSDSEIAEFLVVAPTTVKWFNRQIFKKLGVENRQAAVQRAAALGILAASGEPDFKRNFPAQLTPFMGRTKEVSDISNNLKRPDTRLITILAPGGMGKTRLAIEAAAALVKHYTDGVCFVPLAGLISADPLIATIVDALGLQFGADGRSAKQQLFDALRHKHLLLVLDNFEHLLDSASLVAELLTFAPHVNVIATSRERLKVTGETVYFLGGLAVAEAASNQERDAEALFVVCAQRANPHFSPEDMGSINRICRVVQGMPLAIELAAAWANTLSPAEIAAQIEQSADFLHTTLRDIPDRLRSVRIVFEAAWSRLSDDERTTFRRLSVFRGGCTREAAEAVTGASLLSLSVLVDNALLWRNVVTERYEIHELLRQYAEQQLEAAGESGSVRALHHRTYAKLAAVWGAGMLMDKQQEGLSVIDADEENIREALTYATRQAAAELIEPFADLWNYYDLRSRWEDGDKLFLAACNALEPQPSLALAKLLVGRAVFYERLTLAEAEYEVAKRGYEMILDLGAEAQHALPLAMIVYADGLRDLGRRAEALPIYHQALPIAHALHLPLMVGTLNYHLGTNAYLHGRTDEAKARLIEAYRITVKLNNYWGAGFTLASLAGIAADEGEFDEAERLSHEILRIARPIRFDLAVDLALSMLSIVARERGDWQTVYALNLETLRLRRDTAPHEQIVIALSNLAEAALKRHDFENVRLHIEQVVARLREWTAAEQFVLTRMPDTFARILCIASECLVHKLQFAQAVLLLSCAENCLAADDVDTGSTKRLLDQLVSVLDHCRQVLRTDVFAAAATSGKTLSFDDVLVELSRIA